MALFAVCGTENSAARSAANAVEKFLVAKLFGSDENRVCFDKKFSTKLLSASDEAMLADVRSFNPCASLQTQPQTFSSIAAQTLRDYCCS